MTRGATMRRVLALLAHAEADTAEGRTAGRLAARLRRRHGISTAELAAARLAARDEELLRVVLPWDLPWLAAVAMLAADIHGVRCALVPAGVLIEGRGAGRAARRARAERAQIEARVEAAGGPEGVAQLALGMTMSAGVTAMGGMTFTGSAGTVGGWRIRTSLGAAYGSGALDVYRLVLALRALAPEADRAREQRQARAPQESAPTPSEPTPPPPAGETSPPPSPEPQPEPPTPTPEQSAADQRMLDLVARTRALIATAKPLAQQAPEWTRDVPMSGALAVA